MRCRGPEHFPKITFPQIAPTRLGLAYVIELVVRILLASGFLLYEQSASSYGHFIPRIETWSQCCILLFLTLKTIMYFYVFIENKGVRL